MYSPTSEIRVLDFFTTKPTPRSLATVLMLSWLDCIRTGIFGSSLRIMFTSCTPASSFSVAGLSPRWITNPTSVITPRMFDL